MTVNFWEMKFDGTRYKDKTGIVWELDGTKHDFCAYIGDYYAVLTIHYTHKQLVDMEFEEEIDWSKVPIDTKVVVKNNNDNFNFKRHFAGIDKKTGKVLTWSNGKTSFTTVVTLDWDYAELYKEEERAEE